jgi:hypothetical protein
LGRKKNLRLQQRDSKARYMRCSRAKTGHQKESGIGQEGPRSNTTVCLVIGREQLCRVMNLVQVPQWIPQMQCWRLAAHHALSISPRGKSKQGSPTATKAPYPRTSDVPCNDLSQIARVKRRAHSGTQAYSNTSGLCFCLFSLRTGKMKKCFVLFYL